LCRAERKTFSLRPAEPDPDHAGGGIAYKNHHLIPPPASEEVFLRAIIFANGILRDPELIKGKIQPGDLVIAADGGLIFCDQLGILPDVLIGDFDSLSAERVEALAGSGVLLIRFPANKNFTDLELALQHARSRGIENILVFSALGARWDQTLANLLLPAASSLQGASITLLDEAHEIHLIDSRQGRTELEVVGQPGDIVSLIPIGGDATRVITEGLEYPLKDEELSFGSTRGISNVMLVEKARITLGAGLLVCVVIHASNNMMDDVS
jgi:thiamine pyrophosphokinase